MEGPSIDYLWQGAEARVGIGMFFSRKVIYKERVKKDYRHPQLDQRLTSRRVLQVRLLGRFFLISWQEVRCMVKARKNGVRVPSIMAVDLTEGRFIMELIDGHTLKRTIMENLVDDAQLHDITLEIGRMIAKLHNLDIIHGDLTSSNILVNSKLHPVLIDFGLSCGSNLIEDKAVDLYVLERAISSTHPVECQRLFKTILDGYRKEVKQSKQILAKLADVQLRGRKREMIG